MKSSKSLFAVTEIRLFQLIVVVVLMYAVRAPLTAPACAHLKNVWWDSSRDTTLWGWLESKKARTKETCKNLVVKAEIICNADTGAQSMRTMNFQSLYLIICSFSVTWGNIAAKISLSTSRYAMIVRHLCEIKHRALHLFTRVYSALLYPAVVSLLEQCRTINILDKRQP